ncbi:uncharacterized protein LOC135463872 isoform X2 [Liolophura sinensis]|uniref:uncharacterized protein LOC135463872 isoform X2 n=1 Tax=Liolophura sinensis TaxID=3198878 RepID=UPI0031588EC3
MGVTLERVQNKFACIIGELCSEPVILSKFAIWLDLRLAEYKAKGAISLDCSGENPDPVWLKGHEKDVPVCESSQDYHYNPSPPQSHTEPSVHRSRQRFTSSLTESPEDSSFPAKTVCKKENDSDIECVFPVSLHRSQDHKRSITETHPNSSPSKFRRFVEDITENTVDPALPSSSFNTTDTHADFDQSNGPDEGFLSSVFSSNQSSMLLQSGADNSLTFSPQAGDNSLQQTLALQSKTEDFSLSHDTGGRSNQLKCSVCHRVFSSRSTLRRHRTLHDPSSRRHTCKLCPARFRRLEHLRNHQRRIHPVYWGQVVSNALARVPGETADAQ